MSEQIRIDVELAALENEYNALAKGYKERYVPTWVMRAMALMRRQQQQCDELAEALQQVSNQLKQAGASVPAPENKGTPESAIATGMSIALLLIEEAIAKHRHPQEAPELFPGTLDALRDLGKQREAPPSPDTLLESDAN